MKKIAILTSGGDAPGMNAAVRSATRFAISNGCEVYGIKRGFLGLIENDFEQLNMRSVSDIIQRGGTILRTARCPEFQTTEGQSLAKKFLTKRGIDGVIVIGGDGSFKGAQVLSSLKIPTVGIPGTIDNDLGYTQYTLGFDTACNTVLDAINKLRDTMSSHDRICIVEVMGRESGDIALHTGLGGGAEIILVPEIEVGLSEILDKLDEYASKGKFSSIIVMAEGVGSAETLRHEIKQHTGGGVRATVLGHLQRGGAPSSRDRFLGTCWGVNAAKLLLENHASALVGIKDDRFFDTPIKKGLDTPKTFDLQLYKMALMVSNSTL